MDPSCVAPQQHCTDKYSKSSGVFIGTQKVKTAAFVDDLI